MQHSEKVSKNCIPNATKKRQPASSYRSAAGHAVRQAAPFPLMFRVAKPKPRNPNTPHPEPVRARPIGRERRLHTGVKWGGTPKTRHSGRVTTSQLVETRHSPPCLRLGGRLTQDVARSGRVPQNSPQNSLRKPTQRNSRHQIVR